MSFGQQINWITNLFYVTHQCNCKCAYCKEQFSDTKIPIETLIFNFIVEYKKLPKDWGMYAIFYGGEPLLELSLIKQFMEWYVYNQKDYPNVKWYITTNGLLLDDETTDYLVSLDIGLYVSWDGLENKYRQKQILIHDFLRNTAEKHPDYKKININYCLNNVNQYNVLEDLDSLKGFDNVEKVIIIKLCNTICDPKLMDFNMHIKLWQYLFKDNFKICMMNCDICGLCRGSDNQLNQLKKYI